MGRSMRTCTKDYHGNFECCKSQALIFRFECVRFCRRKKTLIFPLYKNIVFRSRKPTEATEEKSTDELSRIVPLGLTPNEAKGWYLRAVLMPWLVRGGIAIFVASSMLVSMLTSLGTYLESTLTLHMIVEHFIYVSSGFLLTYASHSLLFVASRFQRRTERLYREFLKVNSVFNSWGVIAFVFASLLTVYWYLPANFDAATLSDLTHNQMHVTLLLAGILMYAGSRGLTKQARRIAPIIVGKALGLSGIAMLVTPMSLYSVYPSYEQADAGVIMVVLMLVIDLTVLPLWLYNFFKTAQ
jgi:hypothetical protein